MKKPFLLALLALVAPALSAAEKKPLPKDLPPFGEDKPLPVPAIAQSKLPNGLVVWVVKRPGFPRVAAVLAVRGGTAADPKDAEGIAELLADTVKEGTTTRTSRQIAEDLQAVGGEIGATPGADAIYVTVTGLGSGTPKLLEVLADVVRNASFPAAEVELAKNNAIQGLQARATVMAFDPRVLARVRELAPRARTTLLIERAGLGWVGARPEQLVDWAAAAGATDLGLDYTLVDEPLVAAAHAANLALGVWTVNDPEAIRRMLDLGVDIITSDRPDLAKRLQRGGS